MPLVHPCAQPGCGTLTMGERCLEHELLARRRLRSRIVTRSKHFKAPAVAFGIAVAAALAGRASRST